MTLMLYHPMFQTLRMKGIIGHKMSTANSQNTAFMQHKGPSQPYGFQFSEVTCNSFTVSWKSTEKLDVKSFQVRIFPPEGVKSRSLINDLEESSYTFERLCSGTRYTVGVVAIDSDYRRSTCSSASESTLPLPPTDIDFSDKEITASTFRVRWRAPRGDKEYYEVNLTPTLGVTGATSLTDLLENTCVFTGLVPGTSYNVRVVSVANGRQSDALEKGVITNPGHVYDLTFPSVSHNEMQLIWKPPPGIVECYTLTLTNEKNIGDPVVIRKIKQTSYKFNGLISGRNYHCEIYTHALGKTSVRKTFDQCTLPSEVSNLSVGKVTVDEATITWSHAPGDYEDYDLFLSPRDGVTCEPCPRAIEDNFFQYIGLLPGTKYTVGVVTNSKDKLSQRVVTAFLTEPASCGDITFPATELKSTQIGVHWLPSRGECDSYTVLVIKDGGTGGSWKEEEIKQPRFIFKDLTPGAEYTFKVTALKEGRNSESKSASCSSLPCPAGVIEFPEGGTTTNSIKIAWHPSAGGVDSYKIVAEGGGKKTEEYAKYDAVDYTVKDLLPGTKYDVNVSVISYDVESEPSNASTMTGPDKVRDLSVETISKSKIRVTWSPPGGGLDYCDLTIRPTADVECDTNPREVKVTEYTFERLIPGTLYNITVTPIARGVRGNATDIDGYTLPGDILNVHLPTDYVSTDSMKVVWGVEGNSKDVLATLEMGAGDQNATKTVRSERLHFVNEYVFNGLQSDTKYTVKLQALGSEKLSVAGGQNSVGAISSAVQETQRNANEEKPDSIPTPIENSESEYSSQNGHQNSVVDTVPVQESQDGINASEIDQNLNGDVTQTDAVPKTLKENFPLQHDIQNSVDETVTAAKSIPEKDLSDSKESSVDPPSLLKSLGDDTPLSTSDSSSDND